jgi:plasmid stabilization system protein ParE
MQVELSKFVEPDLEAIANYIAQDSLERAAGFLRKIRQKLSIVAQNPHLYQLRPEIGDHARLPVVGRYLILFRIAGEKVRIERIVYGGRDLPALLL